MLSLSATQPSLHNLVFRFPVSSPARANKPTWRSAARTLGCFKKGWRGRISISSPDSGRGKNAGAGISVLDEAANPAARR